MAEDIRENQMKIASIVSLIRGLDADGNSVNVGLSNLLDCLLRIDGSQLIDFNEASETGIYQFTNSILLNKPDGINYGLLVVFRSLSGFVFQMAIDLWANTIMVRTRTEGKNAWFAWKSITLT